jgi:hypothetical protein
MIAGVCNVKQVGGFNSSLEMCRNCHDVAEYLRERAVPHTSGMPSGNMVCPFLSSP